MDIELPIHIAVLEMTDAPGSAFTVMVNEFDFTQPFELVSVTVYVVVVTGLADGLETVELKPTGELTHTYELPATADAPIEID